MPLLELSAVIAETRGGKESVTQQDTHFLVARGERAIACPITCTLEKAGSLCRVA